MSLPEEEARALDAVQDFMLRICSGEHPLRPITQVRAEARQLMRHYPLVAGQRWLKKVGDSDEN